MGALLGVTRASAGDELSRRRSLQRGLCALVMCLFMVSVASAMTGPIAAQNAPPLEHAEARRQEPSTAATPSAASLARIRRALALDGRTTPSRPDTLRIVDDVALVAGRRAVQVAPALAIVGGADLFGIMDATTGLVPMGGPTHRAMMSVMTPREMTEATSSDVLGIATASAFSLIPYAIKAVGGWLFGDDEAASEHPFLTESEETRALDGMRSDGQVLDAGIRQRGRTITLSLVVPADTPPTAAHALGERFVQLVQGFASEASVSDLEIGTGDYDYIVRVSSPTEAVIAQGGKATSHTRINW